MSETKSSISNVSEKEDTEKKFKEHYVTRYRVFERMSLYDRKSRQYIPFDKPPLWIRDYYICLADGCDFLYDIAWYAVEHMKENHYLPEDHESNVPTKLNFKTEKNPVDEKEVVKPYPHEVVKFEYIRARSPYIIKLRSYITTNALEPNTDIVTRYKCFTCNRRFQSEDEALRHMEDNGLLSLDPWSTRIYTCVECKEKYIPYIPPFPPSQYMCHACKVYYQSLRAALNKLSDEELEELARQGNVKLDDASGGT